MRTPAIEAHVDRSVQPGADFYRFANGEWLKKHPIPDEFSRYGTFDLLREENKKLVKDLIGEVASEHYVPDDKNGSLVARLVGDFYREGMDTAKINEAGITPLLPELNGIEKIRSTGELQQEMIRLYTQGYPSLFFLYPSPDRDHSDMVIANFHQGGMGLHDVDYYRNDDARSREIRERYTSYMEQMFRLAGMEDKEVRKAAGNVMQMETRLAHAAMTRLEQRDPHLTFNIFSPEELEDLSPHFPWLAFMRAMGVDPGNRINVGQPGFLREVSAMLGDTPMESWKHFLKWRVLNGAASFLSEPFETAKFEFYGAFLSDKKSQQPRWKRVTSATESALGEALGKLFVARYFPPKAKERMTVLVEHLREALGNRIRSLDWMSEETREKALEKLARMRVKVGYPDKWRSFDDLKLENRSYYENYKAASVFNMQYELNKIGKPVDRDQWEMTPQTVNAYYHPLLNEIVFPAGILQPPFFYMDGDDAVNYGAIGVVIGHEMTHGFDDQGRKFDVNGNLNDWWKEADAERFTRRAEILVEQFNRIRIHEEVYADGKLTLGENIADLGGVNIALDALRKAWKEHPPPSETGDFNPLQRFFLSYAHIWANNIRDKEKLRLTKEDVHSLGENRVNGPLRNVEAFYEAFGISESDHMYLEEEKRARIW